MKRAIPPFFFFILQIVNGIWNPESVSLILFVRPRLTSHIRITPRIKDPNLLSLRFEILGCQSGGRNVYPFVDFDMFVFRHYHTSPPTFIVSQVEM